MPQPGELNIAESVSELADKASNSYHPVGVFGEFGVEYCWTSWT